MMEKIFQSESRKLLQKMLLQWSSFHLLIFYLSNWYNQNTNFFNKVLCTFRKTDQIVKKYEKNLSHRLHQRQDLWPAWKDSHIFFIVVSQRKCAALTKGEVSEVTHLVSLYCRNSKTQGLLTVERSQGPAIVNTVSLWYIAETWFFWIRSTVKKKKKRHMAKQTRTAFLNGHQQAHFLKFFVKKVSQCRKTYKWIQYGASKPTIGKRLQYQT